MSKTAIHKRLTNTGTLRACSFPAFDLLSTMKALGKVVNKQAIMSRLPDAATLSMLTPISDNL